MSATTLKDKVELGGDDSIGWHSAYRRADQQLVVQWLEYADPAPYDHATMILFSPKQEAQLRMALTVADPASSTIAALAERFQSYWAVRAFADANAITYASEVDFQP